MKLRRPALPSAASLATIVVVVVVVIVIVVGVPAAPRSRVGNHRNWNVPAKLVFDSHYFDGGDTNRRAWHCACGLWRLAGFPRSRTPSAAVPKAVVVVIVVTVSGTVSAPPSAVMVPVPRVVGAPSVFRSSAAAVVRTRVRNKCGR